MKKSYWIAAAILLVVIIWLGSGKLFLTGEPEQRSEGSAENQQEGQLTRVQARWFFATETVREVILYGNSMPSRSVLLRAQTGGSVAAVEVPEGATVRRAQVLVRLDEGGRQARLAEARALERQRELEYQGARSLQGQGLQAERQVAESLALLESARALRRAAELDLQYTAVEAPYAGVLAARPVEVGDYVGVGDPVAEVAELDPLIISGQVSEQQVELVALGQAGRVRLGDGSELEGQVRFIAPTADPATRSFTVELQVENPGSRLPAGMTAEARIPVQRLTGHRLPAAVLTLGTEGELGVKSVDEGGSVRFHPVDLIRTTAEAVWVAGLPERVRLIVVGQDFVQAGDRVEAVETPSP